MSTMLTIPISAADFEQAKKQIKAAKKAAAEIIELRTDYLNSLSIDLVEKLVSYVKKADDNPLPVIVTCRDKKQGGQIDYPLKLRLDILVAALKTGADFIDFEYDNFTKFVDCQEKIKVILASIPNSRLILSEHNFVGNFANIKKLYREISNLHPDAIPKLVYHAQHINDCFDAFDLLHQTSGDRIVFCMGQAGLISRILAKKLGSFLSFASLDDKNATAPGQLTAEQVKNLYRWDIINAGTDIYGVIGDPIAHSVSPAVHNACFNDAKLNKIYLPLHIQGHADEFNKFMLAVLNRPWLGFRGFSVTIPHKQNALTFVKQKGGFVEPLAENICAANTVIITLDSTLKAYNTDYAGALDAITSAMKIERAGLKGLTVAVIGAGGVARAIVAGLADLGAKVKIYNRTLSKAESLAANFNCEYAPLSDMKKLDAALVINCTSIGMYPDTNQTPIPADCLKKGMTVFDTVYNPPKTLLLKNARKKKIKTIDGLSMFVNQAIAQFQLFTKLSAAPKLMKNIISDYLKKTTP